MRDEEEQIQDALHQGIKELARSFHKEPQCEKPLRLDTRLDTSLHPAPSLRLEKPPKPEMGDWAFPCFPLAKTFGQAPPKLAKALLPLVQDLLPEWELELSGSYLNFHLPRAATAVSVLCDIAAQGAEFGTNTRLQGQKIMVEFSSPNTNKPLHLGHLRNNILGESISRILAACAAELNKVNIINDRGVHICKSMLAYQRFGQREEVGAVYWETPENSGRKGDHLVGDYYVRFNNWSKDSKAETTLGKEDPEELAQQMLRQWEEGEASVHVLWQKMRQWVLDGIAQTYQRCDISFDRLYFESETYKLGRELVAKGLECGIFRQRADGAIFIDLADYQLDQKVVQRSDGTSVYITQDLGTAVARHRDFPFDRQIYVVGNEQDYHFKVLFQILQLLGYPWSEQLYHLSYGMVVLPDGKMKSREGSVVDADVLLDELEALALQGLYERVEETEPAAARETAQKIALGALHFYLLQFNPQRQISFDPQESLAFTGNTGPYLQYVGARICSILAKAGEDGAKLDTRRLQGYSSADWAALTGKQSPEWDLLKHLREYPGAVHLAAAELNPSHVVKCLADIARCFSRFYHEVPILQSELCQLRLELCRATLQVLQNGMQLCVIPFLPSM